MNVGMLWFDNDPRTALTAKVAVPLITTIRNMVWYLTCAWFTRPC